MIEVVQTPDGEKVLRYNGRLLASRFDPLSEAKAWLASRMNLLQQVKTVFVLGLGSGHHVMELLKHTPGRIVVLETESEIIEYGHQLAGLKDNRVTIEEIKSASSLRAMDAVKSGVRESFVVLRHGPSVAASSKLYREVQAQLLGRDWGSLTWQWKLKGHPDFDSLPAIGATEKPLTIYDLEQTELVSNSEERERLLFKALRELVK